MCTELKLEYSRDDDIFDESELIQEVFSLSFHSAVVICDFSGSNSSVYYEAGISPQCGHTLDWPLHSARGPRYGFSAFSDRFTSTPEVGVGLWNGGRDYSLG